MITDKNLVVLVHGLGMGKWHLRALSRRLKKSGYDVFLFSYQSRIKTVNFSTDKLIKRCQILSKDVSKIHFMGHSLGGILIKEMLSTWQPLNLGRVVTMGTPYMGSELAAFWSAYKFVRIFYGPALKFLKIINNPDSYGTIHYELLSVAGIWPSKRFWQRSLPKPNDGTVTVASTQVKGACYYSVSCNHFRLPKSKEIALIADHFLKTGKVLNLSI